MLVGVNELSPSVTIDVSGGRGIILAACPRRWTVNRHGRAFGEGALNWQIIEWGLFCPQTFRHGEFATAGERMQEIALMAAMSLLGLDCTKSARRSGGLKRLRQGTKMVAAGPYFP